MLTVEQFLKAGFKFAAGDKICEIDNNKIWTLTTDGATYWSKYGVLAKGFYIQDLTWRKMPIDNTQPLPDNCWVQYEVDVDGYNILNTAKSQNVDWKQKLCKVLHWRPSIEYTIDTMVDKEYEEYLRQDETKITECDRNKFKSGDIVYHNNKRVLVIGWHPHHPVIVVEDYEHIYTVHHSEINK